ncbi:hypothetical protein GH714_036013 [Hevea brasiliensis]|uniref:Peptidase S9 prolyl oligopeptidase catalytic domain-containing protein n=1 Tax=Hevea brasiliensis TaxID=3981 RepID=A0A6A6KSF5_HEVBR|nr:hypothetical protein GH714_036013 [Hevea brasiliensis]
MQSVDENEIKKLKRLRSFNNNMPVTDTITPQILMTAFFSVLRRLYSLHCLDKVFAFDLKTGKQELFFSPLDGGLDESNISPEEKLRRERSRERGLGVTRYERVKTSSKKKAIMVPCLQGFVRSCLKSRNLNSLSSADGLFAICLQIHFQELYSSKVELKLPSLPFSAIIDPHLSPDGTILGYVKDSELHVLNLLYNEPKQLTHGAQGNVVTHGLAEYIAQEEMDRKNGYWWSLDSKFIAFTQVDSSEIPLFRIMHQGKSSVCVEAQEDHGYPFAGASNVKVRLGVVSISGGPITWMDLVCGETGELDNEEEYLARVNWMHGDILIAQVLNRSHSKLKILKFDIMTGQREVILLEEQDTWVNLHECFTPLDKGVTKYAGGFIWASEKTGFRHLYLHDASGLCLGPITEGEWMVEQIAGVNEAAGLVYFTATLDGPLESNLYCTKLYADGSQTFLAQVLLCSLLDGSVIMPLYEQPFTIPQFKRLELDPPEIVELDNRGSARRGLKFEGALKYNAGCVDGEDQLTGAEWLIKQGLAKVGHIGLYGWSYGGYMSAMILARFPDVFRCAVSGAPMTSWDGYDTFYTEKYMGLPSQNPTGYKHTARLVNALVAAGKPYELLIFPDERHMPRQHRDRVYMEERIWEFVDRSL